MALPSKVNGSNHAVSAMGQTPKPESHAVNTTDDAQTLTEAADVQPNALTVAPKEAPTIESLNIILPDGFGSDPLETKDSDAARTYKINRERLLTKYQTEKVTGLRSSAGHLPLKKLKPAHLRMISAHVSGMKSIAIAEQFKVSQASVYRILADPLSKLIIDEFREGMKNDFKAMMPLVADTIRDGLESGSMATRMAAVDRFAKLAPGMDADVDEANAKEGRIAQTQTARETLIKLTRKAVSAVAIDLAPGEEITVEATERTITQTAGD